MRKPIIGIVHRVERLFALADQLDARLAGAQRQVDVLTPPLPPPHGFGATSLDRAFRGELVPQNPADEPASVLLEQIEMQRKNTHESRPRKRL